MIISKQKIIDAVFILSLKYGFDNVSIKQIQEESGVSIGSIYFHFKNKNELLDCMVKIYLRDSVFQFIKEVKEFDGSFIEKINFSFRNKISHFAKKSYVNQYTLVRPDFDQRKFFMMSRGIFHGHPPIRYIFHEIHDNLYNFYFELVQEAIENKEIRDDIDIKTLVIFIQTCLKGYTDLWIFKPSFLIEEVIDANIKMIWEAVKKE